MKTKNYPAILMIFIFFAACNITMAQSPWTQKTDMPTARWVLFSSAVDGKIYAIGGLGFLNTLVAVEVYYE